MSDEILNLQSIHPFKTSESSICNKRRYNTIDSHSGVLASSGEKGLYIYDLNNYEKLSEASTTRKDKLIEYAPFLKLYESEEVSWLEFNCDGSLLLISSSDENNNVKAIKIIDITKTFEQLREIILCTFQPNFQCKLNDLKWHPNENNTLLIVLNDIVHLCNVKNGELLIINSKPNSFCASWSPKGKQFSVVMKSEQNGNFIINQYDNIMTEKRSTEISNVSNEFKVNFSLIPIEICWYSTYNYIIGFRGDTQATEQFKVYTCSFGIKTNKIQVLTDVASSSDCINPSPGPLARLYYLHILEWNMVVLINNSCESAVIYEYDKDSNLEMVSTYCLPIEGNVTGLSCDFTSEKRLKLNSSENKSSGSYPMIIISMSNGYCFGIYLIHSTKILQKKTKIKIQHDKFISNDIIKETKEVIVGNDNRISDNKPNLLLNSEPQGEKNQPSLNKQDKIEINNPSKPNLFGSVDIKNSSNSNFSGPPNNINVKKESLFVMDDVSNSTNTNTVTKINLFGNTNTDALTKPNLFGSVNSEGTKSTLFSSGSAESANKENAHKSSLFSTENLESTKTTFPSTNAETAPKQNLFGSINSENTKTTLFGTNKGESDSKQTLFGSTNSDGTVKQTLFGNIGNVPKTNIFSPTNSHIIPKPTLFSSTNTDSAPLSNLFGSTNSGSTDKTALSTSRDIDCRPIPIPSETENKESVNEVNLLKSEQSEKIVQKTVLKSNIDNSVPLNALIKKLETNTNVKNINSFSTNTSNDKGESFKSTKASSSTRKNILQSQVSGDNNKSDKKIQEDCKTIKIPGNRHSFKMEVVDNVLGDAVNCLKERIEQIKINTNDHIVKSQSLFNQELMKNEISQMFNDTEKYSIIVKKIEMSNNNSNVKSKSLFQDIDLSLEFTTRLQSAISESKEKNKSIKSSGNPLLKKTALNLIDLKEKVNCSLKELEEALDLIEKEKNYEPIVLRNRSQVDDVNRIINVYRKSMCIEKSKIGLLKQHLKSNYEFDTDEFNCSRTTNVKSQFQDHKMEQHLYSLMCKRRVENLSFLSEECNSTLKTNVKKPLKSLSRNINTSRKSAEFLSHNEVKNTMSPARFKLVDKEIYKSPVKIEKTNQNISPINSNEKSKILLNQSLDKPVFNANAAPISELGGTKTIFNPSISKSKFIIPKEHINKDLITSVIPKIEESETSFNFTYNFPPIHTQGCNSENLFMKKPLSSLQSSTNIENSSLHDENNYQQLQNVIKSEKSILSNENQNKDINTSIFTCTELSNTTMVLKSQNSISQVDSSTKVLNTNSTSIKTTVTESNFTIEKPVGGFFTSSITKNQQSSGLIEMPSEKNNSSLQSLPFNKKSGSVSIDNILDQKVTTSTGSAVSSTDVVDPPLTVSSRTSDIFCTVSTSQLGKGIFTNPLISTINTSVVTSSTQLTGLLSNSNALFTLSTSGMQQPGIFGQTSSNKQNGSLFSSPLTTSLSSRGLFTNSVTTAAQQDTAIDKTIESTETSSSVIPTSNINKTGVGSTLSNIFTTQQSGLFSLQSQNQKNSYSESVNKSSTTSLFSVSSPSTQTSGLFGSLSLNKSNEGLVSNTSSSPLFSSANQNQQGELFGTCVVSSQSANSSVKPNSGLFVSSVATKTSSTSLFGSPSVSVGVTQIVSQSNNKVAGGLFSSVSPNNLIGSSNNQQESGLANKSPSLFGNNMKVEQNGGVFTSTTQGSDLFGSASINKSNVLPNSVNGLFSSPTSNSGSGGLFSNSRNSGLFSNPSSNSGSGGLFSNPTTNSGSSGLFSNPTTNSGSSGLFSNPTSNSGSSGLFSNPTSNSGKGGLFSNSGSSGLFSNPTSNSRSGGLFSNPTSNSGSGGLFSNPTSNSETGGLFSSPTSNSGSGSLFSNPTSNSRSGGLFSNLTSNSGSGGLFSSPTSNSGSGGLFSNPTSNSGNSGLLSNSCPSQSGVGLFGGISSNISQQAGLVNQSNKSTNAGLFGNSTSSNQSSGFFGKNAPSPKAGNLFDSSNLFSSQQGEQSQINSTSSGFSFGSSFINGLGGSQVSNNSSNIFASVRTSSSTGNSSNLFVSNNQSSSLFTTNSKATNVQTSSLFGSRPSFGNATPTLGQNNNIQPGGGLFTNSIFGNSNDNQITFGDMATSSDNQESFGMTNDIFQVGNLFQSSSTSPSFTQRRM